MMVMVLMLQVYISFSEHQLSSVCRDVRLFASRVCPLHTRALSALVRMLHSELPAWREEISTGPHQTGTNIFINLSIVTASFHVFEFLFYLKNELYHTVFDLLLI